MPWAIAMMRGWHEVIPFLHFWLVGWLGQSACTSLRGWHQSTRVAPVYKGGLVERNLICRFPTFLQFFKWISIGQKFSWSDLQGRFYMNCFLIECQTTKAKSWSIDASLEFPRLAQTFPNLLAIIGRSNYHGSSSSYQKYSSYGNLKISL